MYIKHADSGTSAGIFATMSDEELRSIALSKDESKIHPMVDAAIDARIDGDTALAERLMVALLP